MFFKSAKKEKQKKKIYILLTRFDDNGARIIRTLTGCNYTHASIGLEEDMNTFYSFVCKGFIVEKVTRYLKPERAPFQCELYSIEVCEKVYKRVKKLISSFVEKKKKFSYTKSGVAMCLFGIAHKKSLSYFCSQFVAEILKKSGASQLKKDSALYLPEDLTKLPGLSLSFRGNLLTLSKHYGILPIAA